MPQVGKLFEEVERPALRPLPPERFPFFEEGTINTPPASAFPTGGLALITPSSLRASYVEQNPSRAYLMEWNLTIQRQLPGSAGLTIGYVGSRGRHLPRSIEDGAELRGAVVDNRPRHFEQNLGRNRGRTWGKQIFLHWRDDSNRFEPLMRESPSGFGNFWPKKRLGPAIARRQTQMQRKAFRLPA